MCSQNKPTNPATFNQFKPFFDLLPQLILILNPAGEILYITPTGAQNLGYRQQDLLGKNWFETCLPPSDIEEIVDHFNALIDRKVIPSEHLIYENPVRTANGQELLYRWQNQFLASDSGEIQGVISQGEDITEQRMEQISLAALEQGQDDLVFLLDHQGRFLRYWTKAPEELFYAPELFLGKTIKELFPPEFYQMLQHSFEAARRGETSLPFEYADPGQKKWYSLIFEQLQNWPGFLIAKIHDLTEKHQQIEALETEVKLRTEALISALQESQKALKLLNISQKISKIGGWEYDLEKQTMWWSDELYHLHGLPLDRKSLEVQKHVAESLQCYPPQEREELQSLFPLAYQGQSYERVYPFKSYDGQNKWVHLLTVPVVEEGRVRRVYGVIADITAYKELELEREAAYNALKASEMHRRNAQELAKIGYWEMEHFNNTLHWSEEVFTLFEQDPDTFQPSYENFLKLLNPEDRACLAQVFEASLSQQTPYNFIHQLKLSGGRIKYLREFGNTQYDPDGKPLLTQGAVQDITELKTIELALKKAKEEAESASRSKSMFLANMSHEIRTPMNAILGFSQLLKEQITDPHWQRYLKIIHNSGESLLALINDILDISKIEAGKLELHPEPTELQPLIQELELLLKPGFENKNLQFTVCLEPKLPPLLKLDALRLRQILINLLSNALKFTPQGSVELCLDYQAQTDHQGFLILEVRDTGLGMSQELQARIFHVFEQGHTSYRKEFEGTGLGLALTHKLTELMGGSLKVKSQLSQGSVFRLCLPVLVCQTSEKVIEETSPVPLNFEPASLLIADDKPENLLLLEALLEPFPLRIYTAENGQVACQVAQQFLPDLILMDIKMPVMDGVEALQVLRKDPRTAQIPMIALTAFSMQNEQEDLLELGFDDFLSKPIQKESLLQTLGHYLKTATSEPPPVLSSPPQALASTAKSELIDALETEWLPRTRAIQNSLIIDELENYARELEHFAQSAQASEIFLSASKLQEQVTHFELEEVPHRLADILNLLQKLAQENLP
ncbi:hypothetical protein COW36_03170 [bacterium (Candidatus Blackallbacteria) CG17_big_fil_post_rev_8_21_14_2_50_48_46]|uniref:histidine kinase n=1 Tax=bacterium (Candidatus Blackallbacteria) CG17_big_fil_post_rev_8_21_14_2_50_48_46 TaxID=2014261 RepID=A0A2M7G9Q5_9BACT|nr:MAG: hypothetical protein COW64_08675 [bacterium (Candidatus Blackallbacteria) CG18_big_fil_WC_8_21_14_2_50_49_26]PIW18857.1 MAG: hypothetical protein COW36_03170 [bacterium (Candidatus Blackallbacteria) CG17_big_fil_post_rev_8_21_14_2_50_48_46]PIW44848.1 MAG: hypothetical protein COW20_22565 [bacterium (Candidatus Blackallbacteria) CG13_big_fil_rev_8_21_14_2_50_49_14]